MLKYVEPRLYLRGGFWWAYFNGRRWSLRTTSAKDAKTVAAIECDGAPTSSLAESIIRRLRTDHELRRVVFRAFADRNKRGAIYFLLSVDSGLVKIGFTTDVTQRMEHIQVHNASETKLLRTIDGTRTDEKAFHAKYKTLRVRGEWFRYEGELAEFLGTNSESDS